MAGIKLGDFGMGASAVLHDVLAANGGLRWSPAVWPWLDKHEARGPPLPVPSGQPQKRPRHEGPEGDGERVGVRGSKGLQPVNGGSCLKDARKLKAPRSRLACGCPSP